MPNARVSLPNHILEILIVTIFITLGILRFQSIWQVLGYGILQVQMSGEKSSTKHLDIRGRL